MRTKRRAPILPQWLPFIGDRLGLVRRLYTLSIDPEDFDLHHVFPVITSLGRLVDRTGEFEPRAGGAGVGLNEAVNSAMGELLERYSAFACESNGKVVSTYGEMERGRVRTVPFEFLTLFSRKQMETPDFPFVEFTQDTPIAWLEGVDLTTGCPIYVPRQLISLGYAPEPNEISNCFYITSSGCALSTSVEGALVSGLLECIERDAVMIRWYARLAPPMLNLDPTQLLGRRLRLQTEGLELRFHDFTLDGEVPVVGVTCIERSGRPCGFVLGSSAALDAAAASRQALIEAGQGRPFIKVLAIQQEAPAAGGTFKDFDSNVRFFAEPSNARYVDWFLQNRRLSTRHFPAVPDSLDAAEVCDLLLKRCSNMRITPIAFDLTTPELRDHGLFVCRVFVPELIPLCIPFAPFFGHPRLANYIDEARREGSAASVPDWVPHPFP
jgi:ribosomal protein S12 methylthiotransferase accessory factor